MPETAEQQVTAATTETENKEPITAENQPPVQEVQQIQQEPLTPQGQQLAELLNFVKANPEAAKTPEVKALLDDLEKFKAAKNKTNVQTDAAIPSEPLKQEEAPQTEPEVKKPEIKSAFFGAPASNKVEFKTPEEWKGYIDKKFSIKDESTFFDSVEKWRKDSQEKGDLERDKNNYDRLFEEIPEPIYNAIESWGKGEDWIDKLKKTIPSIDYNKDFESQSIYEIVNNYFPDKFEREELSGSYKDFDITVQKAVDVAKEKYNFERQQFSNRRAEVQKKADEQIQKLRNSALSSVKKLEQSFPDFDKNEIAQISKVLNSGDTSSLIQNKDGTYKEDAAERVAYMLFGKREISNLKQLMGASQQQLQDTVTRKSDTPRIHGNQDSTITPEKKAAENLQRLVPKTYY